MTDRLNRLKLNSIMGLIYQIIAIVSGFLLPKFFLKHYGSEVYGLISSITQFLAFINLCDLGIGAIVSTALYKPLAINDYETVNTIVSTTKRFFKIVSLILVAYIVILIVIFPTIISKDFDAGFIISLIIVIGASQFGQYFIGVSYQLLLNADQRYYVQLFINSITLVINTIGCIILMNFGIKVQYVKLFSSIIFLVRPILLLIYVKVRYSYLRRVKPNWNSIPQKTSGIIQHISYTVYENTDIVILTTLSSLANVAIYTVYYLVVNSIKTLIIAITGSSTATFGNMIAKNENVELNKFYDLYEWFLHTICSFLFVLTGLLVLDFVSVYTLGVTDCDYYVPVFAVILTVAAFGNCIRVGMYNLIKAAGHYRETQFAGIVETVLNIVLSIVLVNYFGLVGVAIGTLVATAFYTIYEIVYLSKNIICRPIKKFLKQYIIDIIFFIATFLSVFWIKFDVDSYFTWVLKGLLYSLIAFIILIGVEFVFYKDNAIHFIKRFFGRKKKTIY